MATSATAVPRATVTDLLAIAEDCRRHELIDGEIVEKASPTWDHSEAQSSLIEQLKGPFQRGTGGPGGWWIGCEIDVQLAVDQVYRPDVVGWRRERSPEPPRGSPTTVRPDWVCEVLSPTNAASDTVRKLRNYHRSGVPHYWLADPATRTLIVYRWQPEGYLLALSAAAPERVRAEPFAAIELSVAALFGDEDD
ncbi:MAG TPA: Uma2 family endonuclease [Nannocystis sp.]|jgi:Uma2 family endonuclease